MTMNSQADARQPLQERKAWRPERISPKGAVRLAAAIIASIAAILVWTSAQTVADKNADSFKKAITEARAMQTINESTADSAPQQQVVNGWSTVDFLEVLAKQDNAPRDDRPAALLMIGLLLGATFVATSIPLFRSRDEEPLPKAIPSESADGVDPAIPAMSVAHSPAA